MYHKIISMYSSREAVNHYDLMHPSRRKSQWLSSHFCVIRDKTVTALGAI